jgi:protease-4
LAKQAKPVIVSMGNVAASGGYYISCAADTIVAEPNTITGSIGVFGVLFNAQGFMNNKIGVTIDTIKTNMHADIGSIYRPLTASERDIIQKSVEHVYDVFITRVAEGRKLTKEQVDEIGQGRVWSGVDAKRIGLVDVLGGLETAIEIAAKKAGLENYKLVSLPKQKNPIDELISNGTSGVEEAMIKYFLGENAKYYMTLDRLKRYSGIQARMPYEIEIH